MSSADGRKPLVFEVGSQIILKCRMKNHQTRPTSLKKISSGNQVSTRHRPIEVYQEKKEEERKKKNPTPNERTNKFLSQQETTLDVDVVEDGVQYVVHNATPQDSGNYYCLHNNKSVAMKSVTVGCQY